MIERFATVYAVKHKGKVVYVGSTMRGVQRRITQHYKETKTTALSKWLREEDPEIFVEIIELCPVGKRYERETFWIKQHRTATSGFNTDSQAGVGRPKGCSNPSGEKHYLYGKKGCRAAIKASVAARKGKPLSEEHKSKIGAGARPNKKQVIRDDGWLYESVAAAAEDNQVTRGAIIQALRRGTKSAGHGWKYYEVLLGDP